MSLIDEALKRAQEATREVGKPERPWTPAPLPDAGFARRRRMARVLAWSLSVAAALVAGGILVRAVWDASAPEPSRPEAALVVPSPEPTFAETIVTTPSAPPAAAVAVPPRPTRSAPAEPTIAPAGARSVEEPAVVLAPPRTAADGRNYVGAVDLPGGGRIELGGIVWSEEAPRALLNDRIVATDSYVEGFTVTRIEENRVVLEKDGVTISISLK